MCIVATPCGTTTEGALRIQGQKKDVYINWFPKFESVEESYYPVVQNSVVKMSSTKIYTYEWPTKKTTDILFIYCGSGLHWTLFLWSIALLVVFTNNCGAIVDVFFFKYSEKNSFKFFVAVGSPLKIIARQFTCAAWCRWRKALPNHQIR